MPSPDTVPCPRCGRDVALSDGACPIDGTPVDSATAIAVASTIGPDAKSGPPSLDLAVEKVVGEQFGKYVVDELIGRGGMGAVYRVTHSELGNKFALKIMDARIVASVEAHQRFLREARAAARIDHPNVIRVFDHARHTLFGSYLVMELLSGTPLDHVLAKEKQLDEARAIDLALQMCDALGAAHEQGIVHRDLKPANVFLVKVRGAETVKVMDFGVAKVAADPATLLTRPGSVIGTPLYMSPEQWDNAEIDARSDIYSFGVVLYEMLTGQLPIRGSGITEVAKNLATKEPTKPSTYRPGLSPALERIVLRCLEKKAEDRYASMKDVAEALTAARSLAGTTAKDKRSSRRTLVAVSSIAAAVAIGVIGSALGRSLVSPPPPRATAEATTAPPPAPTPSLTPAPPSSSPSPPPSETAAALASASARPKPVQPPVTPFVAKPPTTATASAARRPPSPRGTPSGDVLFGD